MYASPLTHLLIWAFIRIPSLKIGILLLNTSKSLTRNISVIFYPALAANMTPLKLNVPFTAGAILPVRIISFAVPELVL